MDPAAMMAASLSVLLAASIVLLVLYLRLRAEAESRGTESAALQRSLRAENEELRRGLNEATRSAHALHLKEEWYRNLFNSSRDLVVVYRVTSDEFPGQFVDANQVALEKLEYTREKLLSMSALDVEAIREAEAVAPTGPPGIDLLTLSNKEVLGRASAAAARYMQLLVRQILKEKQVMYDAGYVTRTGRMIPVEITAHRFSVEGDPLIVCTAHDVTVRRRTEMALRESERRFQDFFANSPIGVATYDAHLQLSNVNAACLRMFGVPDRNEFARINPFDAPFMPESARDAFYRGAPVRAEVVVDFPTVVKDGLFSTSRVDRAHFEILINTLRLEHDFNPRGRLLQVVDITRQRQAELALRHSERQLRQAQKMEALGTLAGGIAHDFNNILTPILGYSELAVNLCGGENELHDFMVEIHKASERARELVEQILTFSRQADQAGRPMRVTPIVKEVMKHIQASAPANVEIRRSLRTERDLVLATPTQIHQVLTNLCSNSLHAMREKGGVLDVTTTSFTIHHRYGRESAELEPGRYLRISVSDTGVGIAPELLDRVFDPFFTTKPVGEGTGMGLALVHGIVTSLGGSIKVESKVGSGTTFHLILPNVDEEKPEEQKRQKTPLPKGNERILFVDDDEPIVKMAARMLASLGYESVATNQSAKALSLMTENPRRFDLLITDHVMPEITGAELSRRLLELRPDLPIILCTGFSERFTAQDAQKLGIRVFMTKPITIRDLATNIRIALTPAGTHPTGSPARQATAAGENGSPVDGVAGGVETASASAQ